MEWLVQLFPFALEGQWHGAAAVALVLVGVLIFIGTIYVLLVAVYGWLQAYLVTMVALAAFSIILAAVWVIGVPGTIPGTGPRGTEPYWVVFLADSEQGQEFADQIRTFPAGTQPQNGWRLPDASEHYPGNINAEGEIDSVKSVLQPALAGYFQRQETGSSDPASYDFRVAGRPAAQPLPFRPVFTPPAPGPDVTADDRVPPARVFFKADGAVERVDPETERVVEHAEAPNPASRLLVGIELPEVRDDDGNVVHPAIRVFGYRNKGQIFMASLQWMVVSVILFALHVWWLAVYEKRQKRREEQLAAGGLREPARV